LPARSNERNSKSTTSQKSVWKTTPWSGQKLLSAADIPYRGLIGPGEFMHVAKDSPVSDPLAFWVMRTACTQASVWQEAGFDLTMAVNLAPSQLRLRDLAATISKILKETGCSSSRFELEVTEDILVDDPNAINIFHKLKDLGVRVLLDDFGTGYASLSYLKKFPISGLKIDKSFVCQLRVEIEDATIVSSTIGLSTLLGLSVIAEGIEDCGTANLLAQMGCKLGQGYFFGRPMSADEFEWKFLSDARGGKVTWALEKAGINSDCIQGRNVCFRSSATLDDMNAQISRSGHLHHHARPRHDVWHVVRVDTL
jgi:EAL domain-containing protein (putative c-di-GMP-specific phosphodiesterase class I)